jgi:hypothetical protein
LNKSKISFPLIEVLDLLIKNPIIRHQIKFIPSISKPINDAILCSPKQEIMSTEMFKYSNDLITIFREIYGFITTSDDYLKEYESSLKSEDFSVFKNTVINSLNQTLLKLELYFDFGKNPAIKFLKSMQVFDPTKVKYLINSTEEAFNELVSIPEINNLMKSNNILKKSQFSAEFKAYCDSVQGYVKPDHINTNAYIAKYWKSNYDNWKLLAPIVFKYLFVPAKSADVERSFSCYNNILSDKRLSLLEDNLKYDFTVF